MNRVLLLLIIFATLLPPCLFAGNENVSPRLSHYHVRAFCQDSLGYMWIATARGLNRYNGYEFKQYFHDKHDSTTIDNDLIYSLFLDSKQHLWVGTSLGVNRYDFLSGEFIHYDTPYYYVEAIFEDRHGQLWVGTTSGIGIINEDEKKVEFPEDLPPTIRSVNTILEDNRGKLWISTATGLACRNENAEWESIPFPDNAQVNGICLTQQGIFMVATTSGIFFFDPVTNRLLNIPETLSSKSFLCTGNIHFIEEIAPLKYLIGTSSNGLCIYDALLQTLEHNPFEYSKPLDSKQPMRCKVDKQGNIWIGTFDKGIAVFNIEHSIFNRDFHLNNTFRNVFTTRITEDMYHNLWVGTRYQGLYFYGKDGTIKVYDSTNSLIFNENSNLVEELFIDSSGRLWVVCVNRIFCCKFDELGNITVLRMIEFDRESGASSITEDKRKNIWFGLSHALFILKEGDISGEFEKVLDGNISKVYCLADGDIVFSYYESGIYRINEVFEVSKIEMPTKEAEPIAGHCVDIFEDRQKRLWLGTYSHGAMYLKDDECRMFGLTDGLPCNDITCIKSDREGNIWMSTAYGLSLLNPDFTFTNYFECDGTQGDQYHEKATLLRSDGILFFTGNHGLTFFDPRQITHNSNPAPIVIEDMKIQNESVRPGGKAPLLNCDISQTKKIVLDHEHTVISMDYSGIDFLAPQKLTYTYILKGFDQQWNYVGNHRRATYSNLNPGKYTFIVKAINNDGMESLYPATLEIVVKPAPWATWWAYMAYLLVICTILYGFMRLWTKIKMQKQRLESESYERQREREVTEMKMTFFTNISHELRTPLTLISAPVQQLMRSITPNSKEEKLVQIIARNRDRLHRLIDQLLDFRKMEAGMLALKVQPVDIMENIASILDFYASTAAEKQIAIQFNSHKAALEMWYDTDKLEKIMHNLLSNSIKHTPQGGEIIIETREISYFEVSALYKGIHEPEESYLEIIISDTGTGVPPDKLSELFVRYRQIESSRGLKPDYAGTGIGLNYTKRLTEVHRGAIKAEIRKEGGMCFSFVLPLKDVYTDIEKAIPCDIQVYNTDPDYLPDTRPEENDANSLNSHVYTILIAEDNIELMVYFRQMLGENYNILQAADGTLAWEIMEKQTPDLVLSDVMMPGMSGYDLCARIKKNPAFSHIPVILLTAKISLPDQIEGLSHGADAYICKPFNLDYLQLTIENRLNNREKLRIYYSTPQSLSVREEIPVKLNALDRNFMDKLMELLEKELSAPEMNIDNIAREMAFSRSSFYRKLKGLTNMAPADFVRNYRLKRAAEMIQEGSLSLNEIAFETGFRNYTHFSVLFKKHFGKSPRSYNQHIKQ